MTPREKILLGVLGAVSLFFFANRRFHIVGNIIQMTQRLIEGFEGRAKTAYPDTSGHSIGVGHFIQPGEEWMLSATLTDSQIDEIFVKDSQKAASVVTQSVKVPLTDNQKAALTSLVFNIGANHFKGSTLLKKLNAGDYNGAADQFLVWKMSSGKVNNQLLARRQKERALFLA